MNQKIFNIILLKYKAGQCMQKVAGWSCGIMNLPSPKEITNPLKSKFQFFENINAGLRKDERSRWQRMTTGIAAVPLITANAPTNSSQLTKEGTILANGQAPEPIINKTSSPQLLTLSDGTKITLEPECRLSVINFTQPVRQVCLQGKAFFEAACNAQRPFFVYTKNWVIKVPDIGFTIHTVGGEGETVEVKIGRMAVSPKEKKCHSTAKYNATITPDFQVEYHKMRKELISHILKHLHIMVPPLVAIYDKKSNSDETSSFAMQYVETPVSKIVKTLKEACSMKIIFAQNKLSFCLLTVKLKEEIYSRSLRQYTTPLEIP